MSDCTTITISEGVDRYFIRRGIEKKKYVARYLVIGSSVWRDLFMRTLWQQKSVWQPLQDISGEIGISIPRDNQRILSVGLVDHCGNIKSLFVNNLMNVVPIPTATSTCGCKDATCDCAGLCSDANSLTVTTKLVFTINGTNYYEKQWQQICPNGDVLLWTETPTKKYNDLTGDGGDYNPDYNDDYSTTPAPFSDYSIVTVTSQQKVCVLEMLSCGCVKNTEANEKCIIEFCGCFLPYHARNRNRCQGTFSATNDNHLGSVKVSECGTRIIFQPSRHWQEATKKKYPDFLLLNYQTNGRKVGEETTYPEWAENCFYAGIDFESKRFNDRYSLNEKEDARRMYELEKSNIIAFLNPIDLQQLAALQDAPIKY